MSLSTLSIQWSSLAEFLAMGGYGLYVWGSFGVTGAALVIEVVALRRRRKRLLQQLQGKPNEPVDRPVADRSAP